MAGPLPYNLENLSGAACRPLLCPKTPETDLPERLSDIFKPVGPDYEANAANGWFDVGATSAPSQITRNFTTQGYTIEQSNTTLMEEIQENNYQVQIPFAELHQDTLEVVYNSGSEAVAAVPGPDGDGSGVKTFVGNIFNLEHYLLALVVRRKKVQGVVKEGTGTGAIERGRWLAFVAYDASLLAENVSTSFGKGQLAAFQTTFKLNPDDGKPEGQEFGFWFDEDAQVLDLSAGGGG